MLANQMFLVTELLYANPLSSLAVGFIGFATVIWQLNKGLDRLQSSIDGVEMKLDKVRVLKVSWSASWVGVGVGDRDQSCTPTQRQTLRTPVGTVGGVGGRRPPTGLLGEAKYSSPIFTTVACTTTSSLRNRELFFKK